MVGQPMDTVKVKIVIIIFIIIIFIFIIGQGEDADIWSPLFWCGPVCQVIFLWGLTEDYEHNTQVHPGQWGYHYHYQHPGPTWSVRLSLSLSTPRSTLISEVIIINTHRLTLASEVIINVINNNVHPGKWCYLYQHLGSSDVIIINT